MTWCQMIWTWCSHDSGSDKKIARSANLAARAASRLGYPLALLEETIWL